MTEMKKLHLGCGKKYIPGWFHVDALNLEHIDHVGRVEDLSFVADNSVNIIYACHVLEHFGRETYRPALEEWHRVLVPGGILRLAVPDFEAAARLYLSDQLSRGIEEVRGLVCGGQRDQYDFHGMIFDYKSLSDDLHAIGFTTARRWDWRSTDHSNIDDYSQAYIPHMDKDHGTLVSLNIEGVK